MGLSSAASWLSMFATIRAIVCGGVEESRPEEFYIAEGKGVCREIYIKGELYNNERALNSTQINKIREVEV